MSTIEFNSHFNQMTALLQAFAYNLTKNAEDSKDLFQETAFRALRNREKFRQGTNFKAWLFTIMKNIFINNYRKNKRFMKYVSQKISSYFYDKPEAKNNAESNIMFKELIEIIDELDEKFRAPFMMYYEGFSYEEISEKLGLPLGTVKSRIFFARKHIKAGYKAYYENSED